MHDIRFIRDNPDQFDAALERRGLDPVASTILEIDGKRRGLQARLQEMQSRRNQASKEIGARKSKGEDADALIAEVNDIKQQMPQIEGEESGLAAELDSWLMELPNLLDDAVPAGDDEDDNELVRTHGTIPTFSFTPRDHVEIGEGLGQMDFTLGAKVSGARFVVLRHQLARLERALAGFMLDLHTSEFGYVETIPPYLVNTQTMT
ncbi:MAG: serine--tRNA ligase, partial [Candidatus Puniceispirillaceae bacterium]